MSKYTVEVKNICEQYYQNDPENALIPFGFDNLDTIITYAAPKVFNFDFPIFDESYRLPLEKQIIRHYFTREICEETVGLWKLRLQDKLNLIMPYYNQLYLSELIKFNPLYDIDLSRNRNTTGDSDIKTNKTTDGYSNAVENTERDESVTRNGSESTVGNQNGLKVSENEYARNNSEVTQGSETGESGSDVSTNRNNSSVSEDSENSEKSTNSNTTSATTSEGFDSTDTSANSETHSSGRRNDTSDKWDMYSETPQGGLGGVSDESYLTTARHNSDESGSTEDNNQTNESEGHTTNSTGASETGTETNVGVEKNSYSRDKSETANENSTSKEENEYSKTNTNSSNGTEKYDSSGSESNQINESRETTSSGGEDKNVSGVSNRNVRENTNEDVSTSVNNTEQYIEHVVGKQGVGSFSKYLIEFRETFLRIDQMIIDELSPLFFGLW